jgi:hypothetical protein
VPCWISLTYTSTLMLGLGINCVRKELGTEGALRTACSLVRRMYILAIDGLGEIERRVLVINKWRIDATNTWAAAPILPTDVAHE